jgi:hypothetical protein
MGLGGGECTVNYGAPVAIIAYLRQNLELSFNHCGCYICLCMELSGLQSRAEEFCKKVNHRVQSVSEQGTKKRILWR